MNDNQDDLNILRKINNKSKSTQRELAEELGFSLGKLNYCLKALKTKGLIKMKNFEKFYVITNAPLKYTSLRFSQMEYLKRTIPSITQILEQR